MGLLYSLQKGHGARPSHVQKERERIKTEALENYRFARNNGSYCTAFVQLLANWEEILSSWQQLLFLYFMLLLLSSTGGVLFYICEYKPEQNLLNTRTALLSELKTKYNGTNTTRMDLLLTWGQEAVEFVYPTDDFPNGRNKWEFRYSCFFAATTFTTTGFGLQAPATQLGKLGVIIYGLPSVVAYVFISKAIGTVVLSLFASAVNHCGCISYDYYMRHRLSIVGTLSFVLFMAMSGIIFIIRTDEGFGNGVYTYFDAIYFLFQTTMTIGYGDVMMSGGNAMVTLMLGCWLATSIGVFVCLLSEIGESMEQFHRKTIVSRVSRRISSLRVLDSQFRASSDAMARDQGDSKKNVKS